jgi:hypothetical protein
MKRDAPKQKQTYLADDRSHGAMIVQFCFAVPSGLRSGSPFTPNKNGRIDTSGSWALHYFISSPRKGRFVIGAATLKTASGAIYTSGLLLLNRSPGNSWPAGII